MLASTITLVALLAGVVSADRAITTPTNGTAMQPGREVELKWYSDEEDITNFDIALVGLIPLGTFSATNRLVSENMQIPSDTPEGQYYLGVNEQDDNDNDTGVDSYDLRLKTEGQPNDAVTVIYVTSPNTKRDTIYTPGNRALSPRQNANNDDDEILYSPANSTSIAAGSSFNFTYRTDDENPREVLVGLVRYWTGLSGSSSVQTTSERAVWEGSIRIPSEATAGEYSIGVFAERNQQPQIGEYDLTFSSSAQLSGNDVDINGPEQPIVLVVFGDAVASSGSSASQSPSSTPPSTTSGGGGGATVQSSTAASAPATASSSGSASKSAVWNGGFLGGLLLWAML